MKYRRFSYTEREKERFYRKLGYNLFSFNFTQERSKLSRFFYYRRIRMIELRLKLRSLLNLLINRRNLLHLKELEVNKFLLNVTDYIQEVRSYSVSDIKNVEDNKLKVLLTNKSIKFKVKLLRRLLINLRNNIINFRRKKLIRKRKSFNFRGKKIYRLILQHTNNNFFVVLTTLSGDVVWYCSSGQVCEFRNIKRKRSHLLVKQIMYRFLRVIYRFKIRYLFIHIRSHISRHMKKVMLFLDQNRIRTKSIIFDKPLPHHFGQRRKKLRRI